MIKVISLVYRKKGISNKQFLAYWHEKHGPLAVEQIPDVLHYTQNHPVETPGRDDDPDGIVEMWFEDKDDYEEYMEWQSKTEEQMEAESGNRAEYREVMSTTLLQEMTFRK